MKLAGNMVQQNLKEKVKAVEFQTKGENAMTRLKLIVGCLVVLISVGLTSYAQDEDNNTHLGTWVLTVTPPAGGPPAFQAIASFASGGVFIASTQNDHAVPSAGIQQGTWRRNGGGSISSTELSFIYTPTGVAVGTLKVRATYQFTDADDLTGQGQLLRCDLTGSNCIPLPACASIQGKRVEVEEPLCP